MIIVFVLTILKGAITMDVFLNTNWEEVKSCSAVDYGWYLMLFSLYLFFDENLIFFPMLVVLYNLCKVWLAGQQTCGLWGKITQFKYLFLWPNIKQLVFRILWQVDVYTLLVWREWDVNQKKQMCFGGSLCKASRLAGGCCTLFFPCLFVYHNVILMLWIVICEPESAWGWSTCFEEDWKCCHWTEQPTKACLHYKRVRWNVTWSLNAANRALLMLLIRPCLVDESTGGVETI